MSWPSYTISLCVDDPLSAARSSMGKPLINVDFHRMGLTIDDPPSRMAWGRDAGMAHSLGNSVETSEFRTIVLYLYLGIGCLPPFDTAGHPRFNRTVNAMALGFERAGG